MYAIRSYYDASGKRNHHKSKPDSEIIRIPDGMPRIIDDETFNHVESILKSRMHATSQHGNAKTDYLLVGKIICGLCGRAYSGNISRSGRNKSIHIVYKCGRRKKHADCKNKDINRNYIEKFVTLLIKDVTKDEKRVALLLSDYENIKSKLLGQSNEILLSARNKLTEIEQQLSNIVSVITKTGSATLLGTLDDLEKQKGEIMVLISTEEHVITSYSIHYTKLYEAQLFNVSVQAMEIRLKTIGLI